MPYITASIVIQLGATLYGRGRRSEGGRDRAQEDQSIYALRHGHDLPVQGYFTAAA